MAVLNSAGNATFGVVESGGSAIVILIALIILFGAATYFTGRCMAKQDILPVALGSWSFAPR
jgi:hypothetical protein